MASIKLTGDTSGVITVSAPASAGTNTLTLPATTGTILDTNSALASSKLTGALPAISGAALTGISSGGLTLLDTINTTSGTTVTSTTLSLTDYKFVYIDLYSISPATNTTGYLRFTPNGGTGTYFTPTTIASGVSQYGLITHNLDSGFFFGGKRAGGGGGINDTIRNGIHDSDSMGHNTGLSTATTSIAFDYTSGETFDNGVIRIYGLK